MPGTHAIPTLIHFIFGLFVAFWAAAGILAIAVLWVGFAFLRKLDKKLFPLVLAVCLMLASIPAHASSVHVSKRKYVKEVHKIIIATQADALVYVITHHDDTTQITASAVYFTTVMLDSYLVEEDLDLYKHKRKTQDEVDADLAALLHDADNIPGSDDDSQPSLKDHLEQN